MLHYLIPVTWQDTNAQDTKKCSTTIPSQHQWSPWSGPWGICWRHRRSPDKLAEWSLVHSPLSVPWCMQTDCSHPPIKKKMPTIISRVQTGWWTWFWTFMTSFSNVAGDALLPLILQLVNVLGALVSFPPEFSLKRDPFPHLGIWILVLHMYPCNLQKILLFPFSPWWCCRQAAHIYLCKKRTILCYRGCKWAEKVLK